MENICPILILFYLLTIMTSVSIFVLCITLNDISTLWQSPCMCLHLINLNLSIRKGDSTGNFENWTFEFLKNLDVIEQNRLHFRNQRPQITRKHVSKTTELSISLRNIISIPVPCLQIIAFHSLWDRKKFFSQNIALPIEEKNKNTTEKHEMFTSLVFTWIAFVSILFLAHNFQP